jgi:hypothetical protein
MGSNKGLGVAHTTGKARALFVGTLLALFAGFKAVAGVLARLFIYDAPLGFFGISELRTANKKHNGEKGRNEYGCFGHGSFLSSCLQPEA